MMNFDELPYDRQIEILTEVAEQVRPSFGFGADRLSLLNFRENAVFAVERDNTPIAVIRVHRHAYRSLEELESEILWMQALDQFGVPTPPVLSSVDGAAIAKVTGRAGHPNRYCSALAWVDGRPPVENLVASFETLGSLSATIHQHAQSWRRPGWFTRPILDENSIFGGGGVWGNFADLEVLTVDQRSLLNNVAMVVRKRLAGFERTPQSWGLIHGDLMPENILADVSGIRVIDFDDCGFSWFVNDLATAVTMHLGSDQFDDLCSAWISGYRTVRPITDEELSFLPDLIMARLLQFLGWGHTRRFSATAIAMTKSVVEGACGFAEHLLAGGHAR